MGLSDPVLAELAARFDIATEFWDWKGRLTEVSEETIVSVLRSLEVDASTPESARAALKELDDKAWRRTLPPCVVTEEGRGVHVNVHVRAGAGVVVHIRLEDGTTRPAWQTENWTPDREVDGEWRGEATFWLGADLPLGYHRIVARSDDQTAESLLIVTPSFVGFPAAMRGRRIWGYAAQLYSVRSKRSWGIGDLTDLADLAVWSATQQYAGYVLINPLHASQPAPPLEPSPYLPSTRRYINPIYIRPDAIPEFADLGRADRRAVRGIRKKLRRSLNGDAQIMRNEVWQAKIEALRVVYTAGLSPARQMAFEDFIRREGRALRDFAIWSVLTLEHGRNWRDWPAELQRPTSPEVAEFYRSHADEVRFYMWLQWIAETQVSSAQATAKDVGMPIGLIQDLAVGVDRDGADTWMLHDVFAQGASVGAPPDPFNQTGQDWGQPPWRPDRLADLGYAPFRAVVNAALRHAGGVRVDHIIGLFRLWWVPDGKLPCEGTYVRYDHEALVGILALEAYRAQALVIGEDLGTVEPWVRDYLARRGILGTSVLWFEGDEQGQPLDAERWREYCMASVTTHDLPPTAGYLAGDHIRLRHRLGLLTEGLDEELEHSAREQSGWVNKLRASGVLDEGACDPSEITLAMHRYLTRTPSKVLNVALTDAVGDRLTQNQPGTIDEYPNWRVPLSHPDGRPMSLEEVFESASANEIAAVVNGFAELPDSRWSAD
ncbi:MAG: 4-alpha-glucanotransferase [Propionibacteriaceae bacterium]|nr:4-alpha-glucanotransferase [Propionibacteriaceae bacterium]